MKVAICSDLHLEFGDIHLKNDQNVDVLILSGDICVTADIGKPDPNNFMEGARSNRIVDFFKRCSFQFPHVVYVMGNHEHYHGDVAQSANKIRSMLASNMLSNVHLLDKETIDIDGVRFIGGTLWTDMNNEDPTTLAHIRGMMNDFRICKNSNRTISRKVPLYKKDENGNYVTEKVGEITRTVQNGFKFKEEPSTWCPEDAVEDHKKMIQFVEQVYANTEPSMKVIVVGHHAPSKSSTHPRYKDETLMNGGYSSNLNEFILQRPGIKLWTHGHTHEDFDYMLGSCRVVCNPRGYINYEDRADRFELKVIEV